jgi:hypothetical protein
MATKKKHVNNKKKPVAKHTAAAIGKMNPAFYRALTDSLAAAEPTGSCRWTDAMGGFHCAGKVTQSACDNLGGKFFPGGSC